MMPKPSQTIADYLHECAVTSGGFLPRAADADIAELKNQGYEIESWRDSGCSWYRWTQRLSGASDCEFQDDEPSACEDDAWALALQHARTLTGP